MSVTHSAWQIVSLLKSPVICKNNISIICKNLGFKRLKKLKLSTECEEITVLTLCQICLCVVLQRYLLNSVGCYSNYISFFSNK